MNLNLKNNLFTNSIKRVFFRQLIKFSVIGSVIFLLIFLIDKMYVDLNYTEWSFIRFASNLYEIRDFLLNIFFRVAPFLVPIVITTSSFMINRYTGSFFNILFKDKHIRGLLNWYAFYFTFHLLIVSFFPLNKWEANVILYYERYFFIFAIDTILVLLFIISTIITSFEIMFYAQPNKLSEIFKKEISTYINNINDLLFTLEEIDKKMVDNNINLINATIRKFTNLTVSAIKSKDYDTINNNVSLLSNEIWINAIRKSLIFDNNLVRKQINEKYETDFKGFKGYLSKEDKQKVRWLTQKKIINIEFAARENLKALETQIEDVYTDIFENAYSIKEFYACKELITNLENNCKGKKLPKECVFKIYFKLFEIIIRYNHNGFTDYYSEMLIEKIEEILNSISVVETLQPSDYRIYFRMIKSSIDSNKPSILKKVLKSFMKIFLHQDSHGIRDVSHQYLKNSMIYCLDRKKMDCFAEIVKSLVTRSQGLKFDEINKQLCGIMPGRRRENMDFLNDDLILALDNDNYNFQDDIFNIQGDQIYLKLKSYIVFYSYYLLQREISSDRIDKLYMSCSIPVDVQNSIPLKYIRTIILDLQTHIDNWNKLFVSQPLEYFSETVYILSESKKSEEIMKVISSELKLDLFCMFIKKAS